MQRRRSSSYLRQFESRIKSHLIGEWNFRSNLNNTHRDSRQRRRKDIGWKYKRRRLGIWTARTDGTAHLCVIISTQNQFKSYNKNSLNFHTIFMSTNFCNLKNPEKPWYIFRCTHIEYYINKSQSNVNEFSLFFKFRWRNSRSSLEIPPRCAWDIHIIKRNRISQSRWQKCHEL